MSDEKKSPPSFSRAQRWKNIFDRSLRTLLVLAVVVMANYLGAKFSHRFVLDAKRDVPLAPRTLAVLHALTNTVEVTLYFDRQAGFYPDVAALLEKYHAVNKKISVRLVDYIRDGSEAQNTKRKYNLSAATDKDLIIFDCSGNVKMFPGDALLEYGVVGMTEDKKLDIRAVRFNGEKVFTAMLIALENREPLKAYFLTGHGEVPPTDAKDSGFLKFSQTLEQNFCQLFSLQLAGPGSIPDDCNLLVIAAPRAEFTDAELDKIEKYLRDGGRLFVLFNLGSLQRNTKLEPLLRRWGVQVSPDYVEDLAGYTGSNGQQVNPADVVVSRYGKHPVTASLAQLNLQVQTPRAVEKMTGNAANNLQVEELFYSSEASRLSQDRSPVPRTFSLACAVEQKPVAGVVNPRGNTRLIVTGDSIFLGNKYIEAGGNRDFLNAAVNWLVERPQLVEGVGPRAITEFRLLLTAQQQYQLRWLLLGVLPGGVLVIGWLIWFVRRK
jgi:hypothetical protein